MLWTQDPGQRQKEASRMWWILKVPGSEQVEESSKTWGKLWFASPPSYCRAWKIPFSAALSLSLSLHLAPAPHIPDSISGFHGNRLSSWTCPREDENPMGGTWQKTSKVPPPHTGQSCALSHTPKCVIVSVSAEIEHWFQQTPRTWEQSQISSKASVSPPHSIRNIDRTPSGSQTLPQTWRITLCAEKEPAFCTPRAEVILAAP